jgi:GST-like protein
MCAPRRVSATEPLFPASWGEARLGRLNLEMPSPPSTRFAGKAYEDKRPRDRYATESARLLGVLDERLAGRDWVMSADYSIADISLLGWVRNLIGYNEARELVGFDRFLHVQAWLDRGLARPAVQRGLEVTAA